MHTRSTYDEALAAERAGDFKGAFPIFEKVLHEPDIDAGDVLFHCGWCLEQQGRAEWQRALGLYLAAADRTQTSGCKVNSLFRAGWLYMHLKDYAKAATTLRKAIDYSELVGVHTEPYYHAAFWYAVCLESQGRYRDALRWYKFTSTQSPRLDPESRYREMMCFVHIGAYSNALEVALTFDDPSPEGFAQDRYDELRLLSGKERAMLQACLS